MGNNMTSDSQSLEKQAEQLMQSSQLHEVLENIRGKLKDHSTDESFLTSRPSAQEQPPLNLAGFSSDSPENSAPPRDLPPMPLVVRPVSLVRPLTQAVPV